MPTKMTKAEETFLIVRELSGGGEFSWKTFERAADAVFRPTEYDRKCSFRCTLGNILRAQVKHRTIHRVARGRYKFNHRNIRPQSPLYVPARDFLAHGRMTQLLRKTVS